MPGKIIFVPNMIGAEQPVPLEKAVVREKQIERWGSRREERRKLVRKLAFYNFCRIRWRGARIRVRSPLPGSITTQCYHKNATIKSAPRRHRMGEHWRARGAAGDYL